jgi:hypothetical protein
MPAVTNSEKIDDLIRIAERLTVRIDLLEKSVHAIAGQSPEWTLTSERLVFLQRRIDEFEKSLTDSRVSHDTHQRDVIRLQTRFEEHQKSIDKSESRRWGLIGLILGAILSLMANLFIAYLRKSP